MKKTNRKTRLLSVLLCVCMVLSLMPGLPFAVDAAAAEPLTVTIDTGAEITLTDADGDGYYDIGTADELFAFAALVNIDNAVNGGINVELNNNIDVNPGYVFNSDGTVTKDGTAVTDGWRVWTPVCDAWGEYYFGTFNGNYHTVSGLYASEDNASFIRYISYTAIVENVGLENSYFCASNDEASGFVFQTFAKSAIPVIRNCWSSGTVCANKGVAGLLYSASRNVSQAYGAIIENCFYAGNIILTNKNALYTAYGGVSGGTCQITNCFYDNSKLTAASNKRSDGGFTGATTEQFVKGYVAYRMGGVFGQNTDNGEPTSNHPVFNGPQVYETGPCSDRIYSNTPGDVFHNNDLINDQYYDENDLCIYCGTKAYPTGICSNPVYSSTPGELYHDNAKVDGKYYDENDRCLKCGALRASPITELTVGGVAVVEGGVVKTTSGTGWSFDSTTATLSVTDGASLYGGGSGDKLASGIYCEGNLKVITNGTVTISGTSYGINMTVGSLELAVQSGTATVKSMNSQNGIRFSNTASGLSVGVAEGAVLNISGPGSAIVHLSSKDVVLSGKGTVNCNPDIYVPEATLKIDGITLNCAGSSSNPDLWAKSVIIGESAPATVNLQGASSRGINASSGTVSIIGSTVTVGQKTGSTWVSGIYASSINIKDSTVKMDTLAGTGHTNYGFVGNLTVSGNSHILGSVSSTYSDRGFSDGTVTVNGNYYYRTDSTATFAYNTMSAKSAINYFELITEDHLCYTAKGDTHSIVCGDANCPGFATVAENLAHHFDEGAITCSDCGAYLPAEQNADGVYEIGNAGQLYWFAELVNSGKTDVNAVLTADIVINENVINSSGTDANSGVQYRAWTPIGSDTNQYIGAFSGAGHTISGLYGSYDEDYIGLFGYIGQGGTVENLGVIDSAVYGGNSQYGGIIAGRNDGTVRNCYAAGVITGSLAIGGLVGYNTGLVAKGFVIVETRGGSMVARLIGWNQGGTVENCYYCREVSVGAGFGWQNGTVDSKTGHKTPAQFRSGEVAYLLGDGWGQTIGTDEHPVLGGQKVYCGYISCASDAEKIYSNDVIGDVKPGHVGEATCSKLAVCVNCGEEFGSLNADNHAGNTTTTFTSDGDETHSLICSECYQPFNTGSHEGGTATCVTEAVCDICGGFYGGVDYDNHTGEYTVEYDWDLYGDGTCYVNATLRCADCKGYIDSNSGDAQLVESVEAADCRNPGSVTYSVTLTLNGEEYTGTETFEVKSDNHVGQWEDGFCTACGGYQKPTVDPGEDPEWDYDDVYLISNAGQLFWFADHVNNVNNGITGKLMANIDLNPGFTFNADGSYSFNGIEGPFAGGIAGLEPPRMWTPIGSGSPCYAGSFDGNGFTVSGVYAVSEGRYVGLFGNTDYNYEIKNLGITNSYLKGADHVGGLIGYAYTVVKNCFVTDTVYVSGSHSTAAFIGYNGGEIYNSYAMADTFVDTNYRSCNNCYALTEGDGITAVTSEDFLSGKAAYLLQQGVTEEGYYDENDEWVTYIPEIWGQTIGEDAYPVLGGAKVYPITDCMGNAAFSNMEADGEHIDIDSNGRCDVCDCVLESAKPVMMGKSFSLSFEDEILVNFYYTVSDMTYVEEHGMLVFYSDPGTADIAKADDSYIGSYVEASGLYIATTAGIAAKEMGDSRYYCAYAKLSNGTYVYSPLYQYSPKKYATNMIGKASTSEGQKALCVAMLNYGAAAQEYFGYRTDDLMNASLTAEQKALVKAYDASYFTGAVKADTGKLGAFASSSSGFKGASVSVSFEGAFSINYYFTPNATADGTVVMYYWSPEDYKAATVLTAENATGTAAMELQTNGAYWAQVSGIAAKSLDETYYVSAVYTDADGNDHCSGVVAYALSTYCMNNAKPGKSMQELAANTAMYGYYAKQYFTT